MDQACSTVTKFELEDLWTLVQSAPATPKGRTWMDAAATGPVAVQHPDGTSTTFRTLDRALRPILQAISVRTEQSHANVITLLAQIREQVDCARILLAITVTIGGPESETSRTFVLEQTTPPD